MFSFVTDLLFEFLPWRVQLVILAFVALLIGAVVLWAYYG